MNPAFRFVDLFAGLGGFHLAAQSLGGTCVFASEIDARLQQLYLSNFGILPVGDIRKVDIASIPPHELLCAGFPCQPFSKAGSQLGARDSVRGTLLSNILEIVEVKKPEFIVLENVAHFVRHDKGNTYLKLRNALEGLGYAVTSKQLSPHQFGVPHIRERMYMVARRESLNRFAWPEPSDLGTQLSIRNMLDVKPSNAVPVSDNVERCLEVWQEFLELFPKTAKLPSFPIWSMEFGATYPYERKNLTWLNKRDFLRYRGSHGRKLRGDTRRGNRKIATELRPWRGRSFSILEEGIHKAEQRVPPTIQKENRPLAPKDSRVFPLATRNLSGTARGRKETSGAMLFSCARPAFV